MHRIIILILILLGCLSVQSKYTSVSFILDGSINSLDFNFELDKARSQLNRDLFITDYNIIQNNQDCLSIIRQSILKNYTIFIGSPSFKNCFNAISYQYVNVSMLLVGTIFDTTDLGPTVSAGIVRTWEARYLSGVIAGIYSKTKKFGYIYPNKQLETIVDIYSYYMGLFSGSGYDLYSLEVIGAGSSNVTMQTLATKLLITTKQVDIITASTQTSTVYTVANNSGINSIGFGVDARLFAGETVITSIQYAPLPLIARFIQRNYSKLIDIGGFYDNSLYISPYGLKFSRDLIENDLYLFDTINSVIRMFNSNETVFCPLQLSWLGYSFDSCLELQAISNFSWDPRGLIFENKDPEIEVINVFVDWSDPMGIVFAILTTIWNCLVTGTLQDVIFRKANTYRKSSALFCIFILLGVIIANSSVYLWIGQPTNTKCMAKAWMGFVGLTIIISSLIVKNYRIHKVFNSDITNGVFAITNKDLLIYVSPFIGIVVVLMGLWTGIDPLIAYYVVPDSINDPGRRIYYCGSSNPVFVIIALVYILILLSCAIVIAHLTRNVNKDYRETKYIGYIAWNTTLFELLAVGLYIIVGLRYDLQFVIGCFAMWFVSAFAHGALFIPKHYNIMMNNDSSIDNTTMLQTVTFSKSQKSQSSSVDSLRTQKHDSSMGVE